MEKGRHRKQSKVISETIQGKEERRHMIKLTMSGLVILAIDNPEEQ